MAYTSKAIANFFLKKAEAVGKNITPMKLQKLVFYAHGWHLALRDKALINETIEAWPYGPVIRSLYEEFKEFGSSSITRRAIKYKLSDGDLKATTPCVPENDNETLEFLDRIWEVYRKYSGIQLSNMTHAKDTPWEQTVRKYNGEPPTGLDISDDLIKQHFKGMAASNG